MRDEVSNNPLINHQGLPLFEKIKPEHVIPAVDYILNIAEQKFQQLENSLKPTWKDLIQPLEEISELIHHTFSPVSHLQGVANTQPLREAYQQILPKLVAIGLKFGQSKPIYLGLKKIRESPEWNTLDSGQKRTIASKILDSELSGIALEDSLREKFNNLSTELSTTQSTFQNNVLDATKEYSLILQKPEEIDGLPESYLQIASELYNHKFPEKGGSTPHKGPWLVGLDGPSYAPFMESAKNRNLREKLYRTYVTKASSNKHDNTANLTKILQLRLETAKLLGFKTYSELSLTRKMASSIQEIYKLEEELKKASWPFLVQELEELKKFAKEKGFSQNIEPWDVPYWAKRLQEEKFQYTDEELRPYFPLNQVLEGLFSLSKKIFGITVKKNSQKIEVWNKDVQFFDIFSEKNTHIASFYLDPYSRPENKRGGAWMDSCVQRCKKNDMLTIPVAYLVCNSTPPTQDTPSLLTFREVETLFHEFGHGLQHMLTKIEYLDVAGINGIEWDAVELPSQFMENWCYHEKTLLGLSKHFKTNESMPLPLFKKIKESKNFRAATAMLRQIQFGLVDLKLHSEFDPYGKISPFVIQREVALQTSLIPPLEEDRFLCSFTHIFAGGYASGYYSYKWAEVLSADAFSAFEEADLDNEDAISKVGRKFAETVLALGGSLHPMEVFKAFRGRAPSTHALLKHSGLLKA